MICLTNREYRKTTEPCCPHCKGGNIEWDELTVDGDEVTQEVCCADCEFEWYDVFKLKGWRRR